MSKRKAIVVEGMSDILQTLEEISSNIVDCAPSTHDVENKLRVIEQSVSRLEDAMQEMTTAVYEIARELGKSRQQTEKWKKAKLISK